MISVAEAIQLIQKNEPVPIKETCSLLEAGGLVLAEDVFSDNDSPPFAQSAMDGYGFKYSDWEAKGSLKISGEIAAGDFSTQTLPPFSALRIFTGAEVPEGVDTIVMQEKVEIKEKQVFIHDPLLRKGMNIRAKGSQTKKGDLVLKQGTLLTPAGVGLLAGLGISAISVYRQPRVCLISTGNELNSPSEKLSPGKIFESNSYSLNAALRSISIVPQHLLLACDSEAGITKLIADNLSSSDILIISGGVSVGDYDFVAKSCENCGVEKIFHKVKQKPGKPMYFGKFKNTLVFGLPGNPAAFLTCYYEYVAPTLKKMMRLKETASLHLALAGPYTKKPGLTHFLKGRISGDEVVLLSSQESYLMNSFSEADCLVVITEEKNEFQKGERVEVHPIL